MTFTEWLEKEQKLVAAGAKAEEENNEFGPFRNAKDAMEIAWHAAIKNLPERLPPWSAKCRKCGESPTHCHCAG